MWKLIKEYWNWCIFAKKSEIKRLDRIEKIVGTMAECTAKHEIIIEEYNKKSYRTKFLNEHKKFVEFEKESRSIINDLMEHIKEIEKRK